VKLGGAVEELRRSELELAELLRTVADRHAAEVDVHHLATALAEQADQHAQGLGPILARYDVGAEEDELLRDLRELYLKAQETLLRWVTVNQGAQAARDRELLEAAKKLSSETEAQMKWVLTKIKESAPQALTS
jgi:hypothetical protein